MAAARNNYFLIALLVIAALARFWGIGSEAYFFDEYMHIPASHNYVQQGQFWPDLWYHPPLKHILLYCSMKIFGDNPYGWRMRNIVFGVLSVALIFMLARELFDEPRVAFLSALFLSVEPMHIFTSRIASEEIPGMFFLMAAVYAALLYLKGRRYALTLSGAAFGLALATKWYFQPSLILMLAFVLVVLARTEGLRWQKIVYVISTYTLLPAGIYILTFVPWFDRGYSLYEFVQMQAGAYKTLHTVSMTGFFAGSMLPAEWFIKPVVLIRKLSSDWTDYQVYMSNFPVWMLTGPAVIFAINRLLTAFDRNLLLVLLLWASMYLPLLVVNRPILLYSALPMLPSVYMMAAYMLNACIEKTRYSDKYFVGLLIAVAAWGLYLWPLVVRLQVPSVLYDPLGLIGTIVTK